MVISKKSILGALVAVTVGAFVAVPAFATSTTPDPRPICVDGASQGSYVGEWKTNNTVYFHTINNQPLCKDATVFVSSYTMPDNYDGKPFFGNNTAYPQKQFASKKLVLKAGTNGETTVTIATPDACHNAQMDAYIGPEVFTVGADGHQGRAIATQIVVKTKANCQIPEEKKVDVCDPKTGKIISVYESQAHNYLPKDDEACKPKVEVCNPKTGQIISVKPSEVKNYLPKDDEACKPKAQVCNPKTGKIISVKPSEVKNYKPVTDEACKNETVKVCNPANGQIISVKPSEMKNYKPADDKDCQPKVLATTAPAKIASTGPVDTLATTLGLGSLTGAAMYLRNFRRK